MSPARTGVVPGRRRHVRRSFRHGAAQFSARRAARRGWRDPSRRNIERQPPIAGIFLRLRAHERPDFDEAGKLFFTLRAASRRQIGDQSVLMFAAREDLVDRASTPRAERNDWVSRTCAKASASRKGALEARRISSNICGAAPWNEKIDCFSSPTAKNVRRAALLPAPPRNRRPARSRIFHCAALVSCASSTRTWSTPGSSLYSTQAASERSSKAKVRDKIVEIEDVRAPPSSPHSAGRWRRPAAPARASARASQRLCVRRAAPRDALAPRKAQPRSRGALRRAPW